MNLFGRKKQLSIPKDAYIAEPRMYENESGPLGTFALTENVETVLPLSPQYQVDGKTVENWRLVFISVTEQKVIGNLDYFTALKNMDPYVRMKDQERVVIKALSHDEMIDLLSINS